MRKPPSTITTAAGQWAGRQAEPLAACTVEHAQLLFAAVPADKRIKLKGSSILKGLVATRELHL